LAVVPGLVDEGKAIAFSCTGISNQTKTTRKNPQETASAGSSFIQYDEEAFLKSSWSKPNQPM